MNNNNESQMDNLQFSIRPITFSPEDEEKMKNMTTSEKIEFIKKLKEQKKYTID